MITFLRGDVMRGLTITVTQGGVPVNLTGCTLLLEARGNDIPSTPISIAGVILSPTLGTARFPSVGSYLSPANLSGWRALSFAAHVKLTQLSGTVGYSDPFEFAIAANPGDLGTPTYGPEIRSRWSYQLYPNITGFPLGITSQIGSNIDMVTAPPMMLFLSDSVPAANRYIEVSEDAVASFGPWPQAALENHICDIGCYVDIAPAGVNANAFMSIGWGRRPFPFAGSPQEPCAQLQTSGGAYDRVRLFTAKGNNTPGVLIDLGLANQFGYYRLISTPSIPGAPVAGKLEVVQNGTIIYTHTDAATLPDWTISYSGQATLAHYTGTSAGGAKCIYGPVTIEMVPTYGAPLGV